MAKLKNNSTVGGNFIASSEDGKIVFRDNSGVLQYSSDEGVTWNNVEFTGDATAVAGDILSGETAYVSGSKVTGTIPSKSARIYTPSTTDQTISSGQYLSGTQTISGDADLVSTNIKSGVSIFGISGDSNVVDTSSGDAVAGDVLSGKVAFVDGASVTGSMTNNTNNSTSPSVQSNTSIYQIGNSSNGVDGYFGTKLNITGYVDGTTNFRQYIENMRTENIKSGVKVGNSTHYLTGTFTSDATASASDILTGKTGYVNGSKVTGTAPKVYRGTATPDSTLGVDGDYYIQE